VGGTYTSVMTKQSPGSMEVVKQKISEAGFQEVDLHGEVIDMDEITSVDADKILGTSRIREIMNVQALMHRERSIANKERLIVQMWHRLKK
jgi:hypothetical protein